MSRLEQEILDLVAVQLGAGAARPENRLVEELGAESADLLNLVAALEDRYGIVIEEEEVPALETVADVRDLVRRRLDGRPGRAEVRDRSPAPDAPAPPDEASTREP